MKDIRKSVQGVWEVQDSVFDNKYEALVYATEINAPVSFNFFNDVWDSFDRSLLGKYSLNYLYKTRAQQLRDKYDYLILYFSGGSDSYNVLRAFLDNGIKLDELCVKWCTDVLDPAKGIYTPNTDDITAYNYLSEWDYAIKPVLDEVAQSHPEINIKVVNWLTEDAVDRLPDLFKKVNHWHDIELPSLWTWSPSEEKLISEGKTVGGIYGVDKPNVVFTEKQGTMVSFSDACTTMGCPHPDNPTGVEFFYWSPEFPILALEMAYQTMLVFQQDPEYAEIKFSHAIKQNAVAWQNFYQQQQKKLRYKLYDNWTDRFQVLKPERLDRSDKHAWIYRRPEMELYRNRYHELMNQRIKQVRNNLLKFREDTVMYRLIQTRGFPVFTP
jgi:hypothetical protein